MAITSASFGLTSAKLITHNTCQHNVVAITCSTEEFHLPHFVYITCGHIVCHSSSIPSALLWHNICHTHHWHNICQHKPKAITSAIPYVVYHLPQHASVRCWTLVNITVSSDLRKPCCWHSKRLSPADRNFCFFVNKQNLVQLKH